MVRLLVAIDGSRGTRLLSPDVYRTMLGRLHRRSRRGADGSHFGLGWDVVLPVGGDFRFSKNGGVPGIHTYVEHMPGGVDWVVLLNGGDRRPGKPSALGYCTKHIRQAIQQTKRWPPRDLFERPRPRPVRPARRWRHCRQEKRLFSNIWPLAANNGQVPRAFCQCHPACP